jgi:hypothetical protein
MRILFLSLLAVPLVATGLGFTSAPGGEADLPRGQWLLKSETASGEICVTGIDPALDRIEGAGELSPACSRLSLLPAAAAGWNAADGMVAILDADGRKLAEFAEDDFGGYLSVAPGNLNAILFRAGN